MKKDNRRSFFKEAGLGLVTFSVVQSPVSNFWSSVKPAPALFFTNGFKIAEVSSTGAIIWTRLCAQEKPNPVRHQRIEKVFRHPIDFDENMPIDQMDGTVRATGGLVRATLKSGKKTFKSAWVSAVEENDYTVKIPFDKLSPATSYQLTLEAKASEKGDVVTTTGTFSTAPEQNKQETIHLTTSTCQYFWSFDDQERGFKTYDSMRRMNPDFFIHTGDYVYYDKPGPFAKNIEKARHKWHAMDGWPALVNFFQNTPIYMLKDDHDLLSDDVNPNTPSYGQLTYLDGLNLSHQNVPLRDKPYRTIRWGKDIQIWMVEGREYRSPNDIPDSKDKTIWGNTQKQWFQETVAASDATFKILFSPTPVVGPDREKKIDNHANEAFETEGRWLRNYLSKQKNMYVVNGDRHWQYVSVDAETGVTEFGSGPVSDYHAQGWSPDEVRPEHKFLRVKGGFLGIKVERVGGNPGITFTHYDVDGKPVHEEKRNA
jgi:alkaline phosphatase D